MRGGAAAWGEDINKRVSDVADTLIATAGKSTDRHVQFVLGELLPSRRAFARGLGEIDGGDTLAHLLFARLVAESAVRLAWIARDATGGESALRAAIDALTKRDLTFLRAGAVAMHSPTISIDEALNEIPGPLAPRQVDQLVQEASLGGGPGLLFRLCSALVHPGAGLRGLGLYPPDMTMPRFRDVMLTSVVLSSETIELLDAGMGRSSEVDSLLQDDGMATSPSAWAHRLRRRMRRELGDAAPEVKELGFEVRMVDRANWSETLQARFARGDLVWTASATLTGRDADAALSGLLEQARRPPDTTAPATTDDE